MKTRSGTSVALLAGAMVAILLYRLASVAADPDAAVLTPKQARTLIPAAASMSLEELKTLGMADAPSEKLIKNKSLSLILLSLNPPVAGQANPKVLDDFRWDVEFPSPLRIAQALEKSKDKGYGTMIQPDFITDCTCETKGDEAKGSVSFRAPDLYRGKVEFVARRTKDGWRIEEFNLPNYKVRVVRGVNGIWKQAEK